MHFIEIMLIALSLSIDAGVVSFSYGLRECNRFGSALCLAIVTGFFQGFMPFLSGVGTEALKSFVEPYAKPIVFVVFMYLGISFIRDAFRKNKCVRALTMTTLLLVGVATSIDAFSVGIPLSLHYSAILLPVLMIGVITFFVSLGGFYVGKIFKRFDPRYLSILGGVILILIGLKAIL